MVCHLTRFRVKGQRAVATFLEANFVDASYQKCHRVRLGECIAHELSQQQQNLVGCHSCFMQLCRATDLTYDNSYDVDVSFIRQP